MSIAPCVHALLAFDPEYARKVTMLTELKAFSQVVGG
jgi:hypothetical protein